RAARQPPEALDPNTLVAPRPGQEFAEGGGKVLAGDGLHDRVSVVIVPAMPTPEEIHKTIDAYADAIRRQDRDAWVGLFADDAEQVDPVPTPAHVGREAIGAFFDQTLAPYDSIALDAQNVVVCGDEAVMVFTVTVRS